MTDSTSTILEHASAERAHSDLRVKLALAGVVLIWGSAFAGIRLALKAFGPGEMALLRLFFASLALGVNAAIRGVKVPTLREFPMVILQGLLGFGFYHAALNYGEVTVQAGVASLLIATVPIFTAILAVLFLRERMGLSRWLGVLVAFAGVVLIVAGQQGSFTISLGVALIVGCAISAAAYSVMQRPLLRKYSALDLTSWSIWIGTIMLVAFAPGLVRQLRAAPWRMTATVAYLGVFPAATGYVLWNYAISKLPVSRVASFNYLVPVVAIGLGWIVLGELPTGLSLGGVPLAIAGVYLVNRKHESLSDIEH